MGGFFGVVSNDECINDLYFGTDYHSHLGTMRGGLAVWNGTGFRRAIHDITTTQFRAKFDQEYHHFEGRSGIGVISDYEDQPLVMTSHLGTYAIVTVACINNLTELTGELLRTNATAFSEMSRGGINPTELVATLINTQDSYEAGIRHVQASIQGSCSLLLLADDGSIYAARDRYGRTPVVLAQKPGAWAVALESCSFPNLDFGLVRELGPGEVVRLTPEGAETRVAPGRDLQICSFLWVYFGYPASTYEGINVEAARYRCGAALARRDSVVADMVSGVPDSGAGHAIGYAHASGIRFGRPFVKYTPTWPRSFMPQDQRQRDLIARMKLIPVPDLIRGQRLIFCDDSIVRGTQLRDQVHRLYDDGARELHMRIACPPLLFGCRFLNFSRSRSEYDLIARRTVKELEGDDAEVAGYCDPDSPSYAAMVERIRQRLGLTSLHYQRLDDLVTAIGAPAGNLCTYCWSGRDRSLTPACATCTRCVTAATPKTADLPQ